MAEKIPYRRRNFLINKSFQLRFCLYTCSWIFALSLVFPYIIYNLFDFFLRYVMLDPMGPALGDITRLRQEMTWLLVAAESFFLVLTFAISIFISHRIAGPLYKLNMFFAKAKNGELREELYFRKSDHFQEIAGAFNEMMREVGSHAQAAKAAIEKKDFNTALAHLEKMPNLPPANR